jgi:hypothetical protein
MEVSDIQIEALADDFTDKAMEKIYGSRYTELDSLEDDKELSEVWDSLNESFYTAMHNLI